MISDGYCGKVIYKTKYGYLLVDRYTRRIFAGTYEECKAKLNEYMERCTNEEVSV